MAQAAKSLCTNCTYRRNIKLKEGGHHKSLNSRRSYRLETAFVARNIAKKSDINFSDFSWFYIG